MVRLCDWGKYLLAKVLDHSSDASVLELSAASRGAKSAVDTCRPLGTEGLWQHPPGAWEVCGLWRFLGLGDVKRIPSVTLSSKVEFQNLREVLAFFKAASQLAADTMDGQVTYGTFSFKPADVARLSFGVGTFEHQCDSGETEVLFDDRLKCLIEAHRHDGDEVPWINIHVQRSTIEPDPNPLICCSLLLPELRMSASMGNVYDTHDLDTESPLTELCF